MIVETLLLLSGFLGCWIDVTLDWIEAWDWGVVGDRFSCFISLKWLSINKKDNTTLYKLLASSIHQNFDIRYSKDASQQIPMIGIIVLSVYFLSNCQISCQL